MVAHGVHMPLVAFGVQIHCAAVHFVYSHAEDGRRHAQTSHAASELESAPVPAGSLPA